MLATPCPCPGLPSCPASSRGRISACRRKIWRNSAPASRSGKSCANPPAIPRPAFPRAHPRPACPPAARHVGSVGRPRPQPPDRRLLVPERGKKLKRKRRSVKRLLRQRAHRLLDLNRIHPPPSPPASAGYVLRACHPQPRGMGQASLRLPPPC